MTAPTDTPAPKFKPATVKRPLDRLAPAPRRIRWTGAGWVTEDAPLTAEMLRDPLEGTKVLGAYPSADGVARFGVLDIDLHLDRDPTPGELAAVEGFARKKSAELTAEGVHHVLVRGHPLGSSHRMIPTAPIPAARLGRWLRAFAADADPVRVDCFPSEAGGGNAVRLPGRHHGRPDHWSAVWNGTWEPWPNPVVHLLDLEDNPPACFPDPAAAGNDPPPRPAPGPGAKARPGDLFNLAVPVLDVLKARGWAVDREDGDRVRVTRPGKAGGVSASVRDGTVWVFTSSVPGLEPSKKTPYTSFALVAYLDFGGDFGAAARELARTGFCPAPPPIVTVGRDGGGAGSVGSVGRRADSRPRYVPLPSWKPFPVEHLPEPWQTFVAESAGAMGADPSYFALPALAVVAGAVGNTRVVGLKKGWTEPAVVWACVVGESSTLKSPALAAVTEPVRDAQGERIDAYKVEAAGYADRLADWTEGNKAFRKGAAGSCRPRDDDGLPPGDPGPKPEPPTLDRVYCSDTTIERLAELLHENPRGMLVVRDELSGWLGSFTRYKGKAGGTDLPSWLEMHRAGPVTLDRKTGDTRFTFVPRAATSVLGGIQPAVLARQITGEFLASGLVARLLLAMPPTRVKRWTEAEVPDDTLAAVRRSLDALYVLDFFTPEDGRPRPHVCRLSPDAKKLWVEFYDTWAGRQAGAEGELAAAFGKIEAYAARFALLHHVVTTAEATGGTGAVSGEAMAAGIALAGWFARECERVYAMLGETDQEPELRKLVETVVRLTGRHGGRLTARDLRRSNNRLYRSGEDAEAALDRLAGVGRGAGRTTRLPPRGAVRRGTSCPTNLARRTTKPTKPPTTTPPTTAPTARVRTTQPPSRRNPRRRTVRARPRTRCGARDFRRGARGRGRGFVGFVVRRARRRPAR